MYLYSALYVVPHSQGAQVWITQCYLQLHQCLPLPRKRSPYGASPDWGCRHIIAAYFSCIYPERMKGWIGLVTGRFTHINGHLSSGGRAQDRKSSLVRDQRSTTVPRNQPSFPRYNDINLRFSPILPQPCLKPSQDAREFSWDLGYERSWSQITRVLGLAVGETAWSYETMSLHSTGLWRTDGQTDRRRRCLNRALA